MPEFSIILPVKNGGDYVKECVNSILQQTYTDFSLVVLDNNSTDGTLEWIHSVNDPRIKIFPTSVPLSIEENWGRIMGIPKEGYITLIGHDDILGPDYLQVMHTLIEQNPAACLFQAHFDYIDAKGVHVRDCKPMAEKESAAEFLDKFLRKEIDVMGTGFMLRAEDYNKLGGIPGYPNLLFADFELWILATKMSYKATSPAKCFSFRIHQSTTTRSPDIKFHKAFERFVFFLESMKKGSAELALAIDNNFAGFLSFYCKGLSHRLLRTPIEKREGLTVKKFVSKCKEYAKRMGLEASFKPGKIFSLRLAIFIDSNALTRKLFLFFKRIYSKPVLK